MKAEIEVGRNPRAFWLAVAAMASEHAGYYARENGFRANVAMFRAMVDAHNAGVSQLAIQHTLTGASAAVRAAIEDEGDLAPLSLATFGVVTTPVTGGCYGADWALDSRGMECTWTTSGGNSLTCRLEGEWFTLIAEGRRHGIPWRFLQDTGIQESDLLVTALESESSAKPWCDGQGQPLASLNGKLPDLSAVPIAPEPGVWPDWGNYHQQAGWVANKVCDTETFANFAMTCAKFAVPSTAVRYNCGRSLGVFRLASPAWQINWMGSKPLWTAWLTAHRDCSQPIHRHDGQPNWKRYCKQHADSTVWHHSLPAKGDMDAANLIRHVDSIHAGQLAWQHMCRDEQLRIEAACDLRKWYGTDGLRRLQAVWPAIFPV